MNRYYYSFWIRLLDIYPINWIAWELVARSYEHVVRRPRLYRIWDRLFSDVFYLWCARIKAAEKVNDPGDLKVCDLCGRSEIATIVEGEGEPLVIREVGGLCVCGDCEEA